MAKKETQAERLKRWTSRITAANKVYDRWEDEFDCPRLQNYYKGKQWHGLSETEAQKRYFVNFVFATIETQIPSLMFYRPQVKIEPRAAHADDQNSDAAMRAQMSESTVQTFIDDPKLHFKEHTQLAMRDAYARFAVIEVGYTADWIDNPNVGKPVLVDEDRPMQDSGGEAVTQPAQLPTQESLYLKRIPPNTFRVSLSGRNLLEENDFLSYYEWQYVEDLKKNEKYSNTATLKAGGSAADLKPSDPMADAELSRYAGMVKIWKIWDLRKKVKHVLADGHDKFLLEDEPWTVNPFAVLKFYELPDSFYPLPPVFNWISPQDEINETREMMKIHRRRFVRRYTYQAGGIDEAELEKLETGSDGTYAKRNTTDDPIKPIADAPLDHGNTVEELTASKDDFMQVSGVSGDARGAASPQDTTATEANIVNTRLQIRESQSRMQVAEWLSQIARIMLLTVRDKMQLPFWVQMNTDPYAQDAESLQQTGKGWQELTSKQLGDLDVDIKIDIASLSPVSEDAQRMAWNQVLALLTNPALLMILMQPNPSNPMEPSPLLRKTLGYYGIKSDQEVREIMRVGVATLTMLMQQQAMQAATKAGGPSAMSGATPMGAAPGQPAAGLPAVGPSIQ